VGLAEALELESRGAGGAATRGHAGDPVRPRQGRGAGDLPRSSRCWRGRSSTTTSRPSSSATGTRLERQGDRPHRPYPGDLRPSRPHARGSPAGGAAPAGL
jgi:hypothetical protein